VLNTDPLFADLQSSHPRGDQGQALDDDAVGSSLSVGIPLFADLRLLSCWVMIGRAATTLQAGWPQRSWSPEVPPPRA
jgi:hypothetical protein